MVIAAAEAKAAKEFADDKEAEYQAAMAEYNKTINWKLWHVVQYVLI